MERQHFGRFFQKMPPFHIASVQILQPLHAPAKP
jgi:hypothetical protein